MRWNHVLPGPLLLALLACSNGTGTNDGSAPQVQITAPLAGATVNGTVGIDVTAIDDFGVDQVKIYIDNALLTTLFTAPFHANWNTSSYPDNSVHTIKVDALDVAGNLGSTQLNVTVLRGPQ